MDLKLMERNKEMIDTYTTIVAATEGKFTDRGSKFFAYAYPVYNEDEIKNYLDDLKKEHFKARHHCFAYRLGTDGNNYRANDDGEPSGTAGKPILGQLDSYGLSNVIVFVVRYFGGTKLGVPGLINAYKKATIEALEQAELVEKTIDNVYDITFDYGAMSEVMGFLKNETAYIKDQIFNEKPTLKIGVRLSEAEAFLERLNEHLNPYGQERFELEIELLTTG